MVLTLPGDSKLSGPFSYLPMSSNMCDTCTSHVGHQVTRWPINFSRLWKMAETAPASNIFKDTSNPFTMSCKYYRISSPTMVPSNKFTTLHVINLICPTKHLPCPMCTLIGLNVIHNFILRKCNKHIKSCYITWIFRKYKFFIQNLKSVWKRGVLWPTIYPSTKYNLW